MDGRQAKGVPLTQPYGGNYAFVLKLEGRTSTRKYKRGNDKKKVEKENTRDGSTKQGGSVVLL